MNAMNEMNRTEENVQHGPWEEYQRESPLQPNKKNWAALRESFRSDPLAFVDDPQTRTDMAFHISMQENPELEKKKWALAAYYAKMKKEDIRFAYGNLDALIEHYEGKKMTPEAAYSSVAEILNPKQPGEGGASNVLKAMGAGPMRTLSNLFFTVVKAAANDPGRDAVNKMFLDEKGKAAYDSGVESFNRGMDKLHEESAGYYKDVAEQNTGAALEEYWFGRWNNGRWLVNAGKFLAIQAPQQALQIGGAYYMGPLGFTMAIGGSSGIDKYYDLKWDTDLSDEQRMKNAMLTGFINSGAAWLTAGIVKGKIPALNRVQFKNEIMASISYFLSATGLEASQEWVEQIAENAADLHTGVYGDVSKMSPEEYRKHFWNGGGESLLAGGVFGLGGGLTGFRSFRDRQKFTHQVIGGLESERERLMKLENPGDEDVKRLQEINAALDAGNPDQLAATALALAEREAETAKAQEADAARKREQEIEDAETPELGYEIADGMDKETVLKAKEAEEWLAIRNTLRHNPQDTEDAVAEASVFYRDTAFHIVHGRGDYPADVQAEMERIGKNPDQIRAFTYDGNVYVNADRVRPSEVPALLLHEVVGHKGLRAVFGKDFDLLLDSVVKEHLNDQDFRRIAEQYQCDLETVDGARYAAEEYLARYAEQHGAGVKPKWWKETLQRIRVFLSKHHLYRNVRFTDAEIEVALARSIRHTRKQWNNKTIEQGSKKEEDGEDSEIARLRSGEIARSRDVRFAVNEKFNEELEKQRNGTLEAGHIYQLGMPPQVLLDTGVPDLPIELSASRLAEKAGTAHHPFGIEEVRSLPLALEHPIGVFAYGNKEKAQNIVVELQKDGKHFIVGLSLKFEHDGLIVNSIRGLYPKDTHEWLNWIQQGKALYLDKEKIQSMIAQQRRNPADVSYLDLDSLEKIVQDFRNVKEGKDKKEERISNREQGSKKEEGGKDRETGDTGKGGVRFSGGL